MSTAKRHHILPESFQKLFSSDGAQKVWCAMRGKVFETNAVNVAVVGRHYDFAEDGETQTWLEGELSAREGMAIPLLKKLIADGSLKTFNKVDREAITDFLKLCMMRFFEFVDVFDPTNNDIALEEIRNLIRSHFEERGIQPPEDVLSREFLLEAHQSAKKQAVIGPIPQTADFLQNMHLSVVITKHSARFISGEHVAAFFHGIAGSSAILPVCPTLAIRWSQRKTSPIQAVDDARVRRVNEQIFRMSNYSIASEREELDRLNME